MIHLRPFQQDFDARVSEAFASGARDVLGVLPCGAGKSVIAAHRLRQADAPAVFIAHRAELISGESLALARCGVRHRVIGADSLRRECSRRHVQEGLYDHIDRNAKVCIASVDTLVRLEQSDPLLRSARLVVTDECFPAGTGVLTEKGRVAIEKLAVGDEVVAFDESYGIFSNRKITRIFKNVSPDYMVRIVARGHHVLHCTLGHPFLTRAGWKNANELTTDDEVYCDEMYLVPKRHRTNDRAAEIQVSKDREGVLYEGVRYGASDKIREETRSGAAPGCAVFYVRRIRDAFSRLSEKIIRRNGARLLLDKMLDRISFWRFIGDYGKNESQVRFGANEIKKPDAGRRNEKESQPDATRHESRAKNTWRERASAYRSGAKSRFSFARDWFYSAIRNTNKGGKRERISAVIQTGLGECGFENSSRSGRAEPRGNGAKTAGQEKGRFFTWARVDSVEIYERGNNEPPGMGVGDGFVYNIEVEGVHTYVANGVVAHNCHHLTRENKWGKALVMFPNAVGLGLTATPLRADGKGLGRHADGVFDVMVEGPTAREVELMGFLAPHIIYAPPSDLDLSAVPVTGSGDYSPAKLAAATHRSHIVGDVVAHYKQFAEGLLGMTFTVDVAAAIETAAAFKAAGIPAEVVSGNTPAELRNHIFRQFRNRKIVQLVSCEIAGEGFDLPDVEVISLARATESYGLATQQIGRVKRALAGKQHGIVIDHVSNVARHCQAKLCGITGEHYIAVGEREWSLDRRERRTSSKQTALAISTCPECLRSYERVLGRTCPYCSHTVEPAGRSAPEQVDGVLRELDPAALAALHGEVLRIDGPAQIPFGATAAVGGAVVKRHRERQDAQRELRAAIAEWAGHYGRTIDEAQRAFWLAFGVDVMTAQTLGRAEADALRERIIVDAPGNFR